jgi:hypothetical protein
MRCTKPFPCLADIYVLSGLTVPCSVCSANVDHMRALHGWTRRGEFYISNDLTSDQITILQTEINHAALAGKE